MGDAAAAFQPIESDLMDQLREQARLVEALLFAAVEPLDMATLVASLLQVYAWRQLSGGQIAPLNPQPLPPQPPPQFSPPPQ